jgi:hypothetical protein
LLFSINIERISTLLLSGNVSNFKLKFLSPMLLSFSKQKQQIKHIFVI